jgi:hypothetical protein
LGDLGIFVGREEEGGHPSAENREGLLQPGKDSAYGAKRKSNGQGANQETAPQTIEDMAEQQWQASVHDSI